MKRSLGQQLRKTLMPAAGVLATGLIVNACSDDKSSPAAVTLEDLKYASGLSITDLGDGKVRLQWQGSNNEEDFSGYNIYGAKVTALPENEDPIELLDEKGEVVAKGRERLEGMSYNGKDWETVGEAAKPKDKDEGEYTFTAFYKNKDEDGNPMLPTCQPTTDGTHGKQCTITDKDEVTPTKLNGQTYIELDSLKVGSTYCFTVLATLDDGTKAASTTSEVKCVTPRANVVGSTLAAACKDVNNNEHSTRFNVTALRTACATGTCGTITTVKSKFDCNTAKTAADGKPGAGDGCFEVLGDKGTPEKPDTFFTTTDTVAFQDLGVYSGFEDPTLPKLPLLNAIGTVASKDGYGAQDQSLRLAAGHVYAVAEIADGKKYYHLAYAKTAALAAACDTTANTLTLDWRISTAADKQ